MKRAVDIVISALALVVLAPLLAAIALAVRATSRGPVLYRQTRVGRGGVPFTMFKFRTMRHDASDDPHREHVTSLIRDGADARGDGSNKLVDDPRVTRVGNVLRRTSLDELPQLVNVLRGDMSLVGPRPAMAYEVELYDDEHRRRLEVLPGLTGLWQVSGRNRLSMRQMLDLDVRYVEERSLVLDLRILAATVPVLVRGDGAR